MHWLVSLKLSAYAVANWADPLYRLVAYFVVFWVNGFSPSDLRVAQQDGGYFEKGSSDFINGRGQRINADKQIDALGQAQSIGEHSIRPM